MKAPIQIIFNRARNTNSVFQQIKQIKTTDQISATLVYQSCATPSDFSLDLVIFRLI